MADRRPHFPDIGIRPRDGTRRRILILERITPFDVEMVYSMAYWWQTLSDATVSVINVWPLQTYGALPAAIDLDDFDAVVLFPRLAYDPVTLRFLDRHLDRSFREYSGVKVLMRQDENLMTSLIEDFIIEHEFDVFLTCVPQDQVPIAYPRLAGSPTDVHTILTGYITPDMRSFERAPHTQRTFDITYRAYRGGLAGGELVHEKYRIGVDAQRHFADLGLNLDIAMDPAQRLIGTDWRNRLNDSKAVLATESGSNVFDFDGSLYRWAELFDFEHRNSDMTYPERYELARARLAPHEGNVRYAQVSPRHFEAAAFGCLQVMFPGRYSGIFQSDRHYIELDPSFSNAAEVADVINDPTRHAEITERAVEDIVMDPAYSIETALEALDQLILARVDAKQVASVASTPPEGLETPLQASDAIVLHLMTTPSVLGRFPYYLDESIRSDRLMCVRLVFDQDPPPPRPPGGAFPWMHLSPSTIIASRPGRQGLDVGLRDGAIASLDRAAAYSRDEALEYLGGYDDRFGTVEAFQRQCRLALGAIGAASAWERDVAPASVIASDPVILPAAAELARRSNALLLIDFAGCSRFIGPLPGWQASFWERLMVALLDANPNSEVLVDTEQAANRAKAILGADSTRIGDPHRPLLHPDGRPRHEEPPTGDAAMEAVARTVDTHRFQPDAPSRDVESVETEVLPAIEESFGLASVRYWNEVRDSVRFCTDRVDLDAAHHILHTALTSYVHASSREAPTSPLAELLALRRAHLLNSFMAVEPSMPLGRARAVFDRIERGDIPTTEANLRGAWRLAIRLLDVGEHEAHQALVDTLAAPGLIDSAEGTRATVNGHLNVLAFHWARQDHAGALPSADLLMELHDRLPPDHPDRLDANVLARIAVVREHATTNDGRVEP